jgi:hypothetical protein
MIFYKVSCLEVYLSGSVTSRDQSARWSKKRPHIILVSYESPRALQDLLLSLYIDYFNLQLQVNWLVATVWHKVLDSKIDLNQRAFVVMQRESNLSCPTSFEMILQENLQCDFSSTISFLSIYALIA